MKSQQMELLNFRVEKAIGSMAIDGIPVSCETKADMLRVARGDVSVEDVIRKLVERHRKDSAR